MRVENIAPFLADSVCSLVNSLFLLRLVVSIKWFLLECGCHRNAVSGWISFSEEKTAVATSCDMHSVCRREGVHVCLNSISHKIWMQGRPIYVRRAIWIFHTNVMHTRSNIDCLEQKTRIQLLAGWRQFLKFSTNDISQNKNNCERTAGESSK